MNASSRLHQPIRFWEFASIFSWLHVHPLSGGTGISSRLHASSATISPRLHQPFSGCNSDSHVIVFTYICYVIVMIFVFIRSI